VEPRFLMAEIRGRVEQLESSLPRRVDAMVSPDSKLVFKALLYRAAPIRRMAELSRGGFENFDKGRLQGDGADKPTPAGPPSTA
jgi:hypothetical protein